MLYEECKSETERMIIRAADSAGRILVFGVARELLLVHAVGHQLDIATTAVNLLGELDLELQDEVLALVVEGGELRRGGVETSIL